jgi:AcrR family transcriptional regulator
MNREVFPMKKTRLRLARERQRRQENRETILHAAESVILRRGFSDISMDDVAAEADFSKATLYKYFKSKAELVFEILIHFLEDSERMLRSIRERDSSAGGRLYESLLATVRFEAEKKNITRLFMADSSFMKLMQTFVVDRGRSSSAAEKRFVQKIKATRRTIMDGVGLLLAQGIESGEFRPHDVRAGAVFLGSVIEGYFQEKFWADTKTDIEDDINFIFEFVMRGLDRKDL